MRTFENKVDGIKLGRLTKKYDSLTDFGKEMLFCWMVGYGDMFDNETRLRSLEEEMDNWITREK
jgi:hypothetical protein